MSIRESLGNIIFDKTFKEKVRFLRQVSLFSGLSNRSLGKIVSIMHEKLYAENEAVFSEGQEGKVFYIVKSGKVKVKKGKRNFCELGPGGYFGEMALLEEAPRAMTVAAAEPTELYLIYKIKFDELIENNPAMGVRVLRALVSLLCERLRQPAEHNSSGTPEGNVSCEG